jgi:hypothetical protein
MHRAIWEMHHGTLPKGMGIDHIDHNKLNNCLKNIRTATSSQNNHNQSKRKTSEFKGITYKGGSKKTHDLNRGMNCDQMLKW